MNPGIKWLAVALWISAAAHGSDNPARSGALVLPELSGCKWNIAGDRASVSLSGGSVTVPKAHVACGGETIEADLAEGTLPLEDSSWKFSGHVQVQVTQGSLSADIATVQFAAGKVVLITAHGAPSSFMQDAAQGGAHGYAEDIAYDLRSGDVHGSGGARVSRDRYDFDGEFIYNVIHQTIDVKQFHSTIQPLPPATPGAGSAK
ncbi:MAG TPA: LptA/OstA family protein [Steroidobacteraceae bacterium]